jgi:hypothetical protein
VIDNVGLSPIPEDCYYRRTRKEVDDWESITNDLFVADVSRNIPCCSTCTQCGKVLEKPIRCKDSCIIAGHLLSSATFVR